MAIVEYEKKSSHVVVIVLNRPDRLNAIDEAMLASLREAWTRYGNDDDAWMAILTGAGKAFSAGADKSWFEKTLKGEASPEVFLDLIRKDLYWSGQLDKPVLTAVNGMAVGAGLDLVLRSDLRIAAKSSWFQQPEVEKGTLMIFNDNLPCAIAAEMVAGFRITAQRAYEVGMVNRVVPDKNLIDSALELAEELLTKTPLALYHALKILRDMKNVATIMPRHLIDHYTTLISKDLTRTEDFREATTALLEKRKPVFKKR
jgi:enoyl-CoA hydratase/carnithine racemase